MAAVHAGAAGDRVPLTQVDTSVARALVVEPAGPHDRVGAATDAHEALGPPLPLHEAVAAAARRAARVHRRHEADVGPGLQGFQDRQMTTLWTVP